MGKGHRPPRASSRAAGSDHHPRQRLWLACAVGAAVIGVGVALTKSNVSLSPQPVAPMQRPPNLKKSRAAKASAAQPATPPPPQKKAGKKCRDSDTSCSSWAGAGECNANPGFMLDSCPVSCNACPAGDEDPACVRRNSTPAVQDRGISAVFERALREYPQYKPRALSRDPWVMTFDDFLSEEETERIIELCSSSFERSLAGDQLSPVRTSHQCWCQVPPCINDPVVQRIRRLLIDPNPPSISLNPSPHPLPNPLSRPELLKQVTRQPRKKPDRSKATAAAAAAAAAATAAAAPHPQRLTVALTSSGSASTSATASPTHAPSVDHQAEFEAHGPLTLTRTRT